MGKITVDFRGITPAQGGGGSIHVPRGLYTIKLTKHEQPARQDGKSTVRASFEIIRGPLDRQVQGAPDQYMGGRVQDEFFLDGNEKGNRFGAQRYMAFIESFGQKVEPKVLEFDGDRFLNRVMVAEIDDNTIPASKELGPDGNPKYPERTISRPVAYYNPRALPPEIVARIPGDAQAAPAVAQSAAAPAVAPTAASTPVELTAVAPVAPTAASAMIPDDPFQEAAPAPAATPAPVAVAAAPAQINGYNGPDAGTSEVEAAVDDLFK